MAKVVRAADPDASVPAAVLEATRALLRVTTASEARLIGEELVRRLGGELATSETESRSVIPADLSFGDGAPVLAAARAGSAARSLIERYLTAYLLDASFVLELNLRGERLAEFASIDSLTGVLNRRMIDRALGRLVGGDTVILMDLDHFKHVNDEFGHAAGDDVLRAFSSVLGNAGRSGDVVVGRFGGEEFVAVLDAPGNGPDVFLERFRRDWLAARPLPVTFSAGIARSVGDPDETIGLADEALYRAKKAGRDQWCWATSAGPLTAAAAAEYVQPYLADAVAGRRRPAVRLAINLLDNRVALDLIVENLLAVAQHMVGDRWQRNELTAADEHLATGVAAAVMDALSGETQTPHGAGLTVVTCAEGDWHSLAAQMFGVSLRSHGVGVTVLGASTPTDVVAEFLDRSGGDSLAISCSMPIFFPGARRLADAAHQQGIPVIMGGRAFGTDARRAMRLGADAWALSAREAAVILATWKANPPAIDAAPTPVDPPQMHLIEEAHALTLAALPGPAAVHPPLADYDERQMGRMREYLAYLVQFLGAAQMVEDPTVFTEFLVWLRDFLECRGVPANTLVAGLQALHPVVEKVVPDAARLLDRGHQMLVDNPAATSRCATSRGPTPSGQRPNATQRDDDPRFCAVAAHRKDNRDGFATSRPHPPANSGR